MYYPLRHLNNTEVIKFWLVFSELSQLLLKEIEKGNLDSIKGIINSIEDENMRLEVVNASNDQGQSVLFLACVHNHEKVVAELLKQNCDVNYPTNEKHEFPGSTPLTYSAYYANRLPISKLLLHHNANIRHQRKDKSDATGLAALNGNLDVIKEIVARDPGVIEFKGFIGRTPLSTAAQNGYLNVCNYLLTEKNANVSAQDEAESTALTLAAEKGHINVVKLLLDNNANIRHQKKDKSHATDDAAEEGHLDVIKEIVARDPGVIDFKGFVGRTPLLSAAQNGQLNVCNYLLIEKNANVNTQDEEQSTALILAASQNHLNVVELLLKNNAKNLKDKWNRSALDRAVQKNNEDMIKLLKNYFGEM